MIDSIVNSFDIWTDAQGIKSRTRVKSVDNISLEGIAFLRKLIQELAVRGRLVPQDPNEEPAKELIKQIEFEKKQLIKDGKLKSQNNYPEITNKEKPFKLPSGWEFARFGNVTFNRDSERIPLSVEERSMRKGVYDYYGASGVIDYIDNFIFDKPLLLIGEDGANLVNRSTPIAFIAKGKYWVNNHAHVVDGISEEYLKFMCLHINAISLLSYITGTAQPKMNQAKMNSIVLAIPPLAEQYRILAKVDELMALCDLLEEEQLTNLKTHQVLVKTLLETLTQTADVTELQAAWERMSAHFDTLFCTEDSIDQLKQTILQLAVMGKLVKQDPNDEPASELLKRIEKERGYKKETDVSEIKENEKLFALPQGWEWIRLQQIIQISSGDGLISTNMNASGNIPVFGGNGINGYHDKGNISKPTLVIGRVGYYCGSIHITPSAAWVTDNAFITSFSEDNIYLNFLYWLLKGTNLKENDSATAQPVISGRKVYPIVVALPPLAEQKRIVDKIEELFALCESLKEKVQKSQDLKVLLAKTIVEKAVQ